MLRTCLIIVLAAALAGCASQQQAAQNEQPAEQRFGMDGRPYDPVRDANVDLYIANWHESEPYRVHGDLEEYDILTQGDPLDPPQKGAVLKYTNRYTCARLAPGRSTGSVTLTGQQEVIYVFGGSGTIRAGGDTVQLRDGMCVLIPESLAFTMRNTGNEPLEMYLINEPVPDGFTPNTELVVVDEKATPIGGTDWHWAHIGRDLLSKGDGLATMYSVLTIGLDPMTISHPHSHDPGCEEVWTAISGTSIAFLGKQVRSQPPGTAYNIPPDRKTPHCNLNTSDEQIKLLYFSIRKDIDGTGL